MADETGPNRVLRFVVTGALMVGPLSAGCGEEPAVNEPVETINEPPEQPMPEPVEEPAPDLPVDEPTPNEVVEEPRPNLPPEPVVPPPPPVRPTPNLPAPRADEGPGAGVTPTE